MWRRERGRGVEREREGGGGAWYIQIHRWTNSLDQVRQNFSDISGGRIPQLPLSFTLRLSFHFRLSFFLKKNQVIRSSWPGSSQANFFPHPLRFQSGKSGICFFPGLFLFRSLHCTKSTFMFVLRAEMLSESSSAPTSGTDPPKTTTWVFEGKRCAPYPQAADRYCFCWWVITVYLPYPHYYRTSRRRRDRNGGETFRLLRGFISVRFSRSSLVSNLRLMKPLREQNVSLPFHSRLCLDVLK